MFKFNGKNLILYPVVLSVLALGSACNTVNNTLASLTGIASTDTSGNLWATISADMSVTDYGLDELNVPVIDPSNPLIEYGSINIAPVVCSGAGSCVNGGVVTLSLNLTALTNVSTSNTELPNGTAFPITFTSAATRLIAIPVGSGGAKIYAALGGGTTFIGTAIPFSGLDGAGKYTPGLDIFGTANFDNNLITSYFGYFAGNGVDQTGVGLFADLSKIVASAQPAGQSGVSAELPSAEGVTSFLRKKSNRSEYEQQKFFYHLWKLGHDKHPILRYENGKN